MKSLYTIILISFLSVSLFAQDATVPKFTSDVGLKITSRHYWRGIPVSSAPCFEGSLAVKTGGFTIGYWGGYAFDKTYSEFDFFTSYEIGNFTISLWDLYVISDETDFLDYHPDQRYWDFDRKTTTHNFDLTAAYQFDGKFPLKLALSSMIWGADRDEKGDQRYSTYLELGYPVKVNPVTKLDFFLGTILNNEDSAYGDSFGVVHTGVSGTRIINISDTFSLPVTATIAMNPQKEIGYLVFAIGF